MLSLVVSESSWIYLPQKGHNNGLYSELAKSESYINIYAGLSYLYSVGLLKLIFWARHFNYANHLCALYKSRLDLTLQYI